MKMMLEKKRKPAFADWTDDDFDVLDRIGKGPKIIIEKNELQIPSDTELTEWEESVDALDETTEIYLED